LINYLEKASQNHYSPDQQVKEGTIDTAIKAAIKECKQLHPIVKDISNKTRFQMLCILNVGEKNVGELQELIGAKQAYISQQLKYLKQAGYLKSRKEGTYVYYRLADGRFPKLLKALNPLLK